jgi:hypothetical protein
MNRKRLLMSAYKLIEVIRNGNEQDIFDAILNIDIHADYLEKQLSDDDGIESILDAIGWDRVAEYFEDKLDKEYSECFQEGRTMQKMGASRYQDMLDR